MYARQTTDGPPSSLAPELKRAVRSYLGGQRGLLILSGIIIVTALALNWSWLSVLGVAPLILALAPCAAMCALGVCMSRKGTPDAGESGSGSASPSPLPIIEHVPTKE
jgi:hypothetical protein